MKAKEQIWLGDILVKDDGMLRRMISEDAGDFIGPEPWRFEFDKILIIYVAGANANIGEEVIVYTKDTVFEIQT